MHTVYKVVRRYYGVHNDPTMYVSFGVEYGPGKRGIHYFNVTQELPYTITHDDPLFVFDNEQAARDYDSFLGCDIFLCTTTSINAAPPYIFNPYILDEFENFKYTISDILKNSVSNVPKKSQAGEIHIFMPTPAGTLLVHDLTFIRGLEDD